MTNESDVLLDCSNELYRLARNAKDLRWKKELLDRARELGEMREASPAIITLKNLAIKADEIIRLNT